MRLLFFILLLTGCATPYQEVSIRGGYSEMRVAEDIYQVNFRGNGYTGLTTIRDFWLRRSAEIATQNGRQFFEVLEVDRTADTTLVTNGGATRVVNKHTATGRIRLLDSYNPSNPNIYDAKIILGNYAH